MFNVTALCEKNPEKEAKARVCLETALSVLSDPMFILDLASRNPPRSFSPEIVTVEQPSVKEEVNHDMIYTKLQAYFKRPYFLTDLIDLAKKLEKEFGILASRDTKRSKPKMLQWYQDNWDTFKGYLKSE